MAVISDKIPGPLQGMGDHQVIEEGSIFLPHLERLCTFQVKLRVLH